MIKNITKIIFILCIILVNTTPTFAQYELKNSLYFMKDDGIFSPEEKDEEAEYVRQQCESNSFESQYYDCSCIAGAFRIRRDDEKLLPQDHILYDLYNDPDTKCIDPVNIAGSIYKTCQNYAKYFRERMADNEKYCECVAKKATKKFAESPKLKSSFTNRVKLNAMTSCGMEFNQPL